MTRVPVNAFFFEDFIDGYFPLSRSLHHLIDRQGVDQALVVLRVAPMMEIPGLNLEDPVPLHINPEHAGQIDWLAVALRRVADSVRVSGHARWYWNDQRRQGRRDLPSSTRLAEPAFVRGIGFGDGCQSRTSKVRVQIKKEIYRIPIPSRAPDRSGQGVPSHEIAWPLPDNGRISQVSAADDLRATDEFDQTPENVFVFSRNQSPAAGRFSFDLLGAIDCETLPASRPGCPLIPKAPAMF